MQFKTTLLITSTVLILANTAVAQAQTRNVLREAAPTQNNVIIANSPQDIALQEQIRMINQNNAYIDSMIGISDSQVATTTLAANPYQGSHVEIYQQSQTVAPYTSSSSTDLDQGLSAIPAANSVRYMPAPSVTMPSTTYHSVVKGDTLYSLARRNCISVGEIQHQNQMSNTNLQLGQVLTLPPSQCADSIAASANIEQPYSKSYVRTVLPVPINVGIRNTRYAVLPKDTLYSISKNYCTTPQSLASANGITTTSAIHPGQFLTLPQEACIN